MKQKRGQFFILAAIILVSIIVGFSLYSNQVFFQGGKGGVYSLKSEVEGETGKVIDYGLYTGEERLSDFVGEMSSSLLERNSDLELVFFFGNSSVLEVINLGENNITLTMENTEVNITGIKGSLGSVSWGSSGTSIDISSLRTLNLIQEIQLDNLEKITFTLEGTKYEIDLIGNKNFYFVIKKEQGDEVYVTVG